jgi:hypothetical protein
MAASAKFVGKKPAAARVGIRYLRFFIIAYRLETGFCVVPFEKASTLITKAAALAEIFKLALPI